jgi:RNA recognition motif-containing protein
MKLHIGNLPKTGTDEQFKELLSPFGEATLELVKDNTGVSKGFGFADFANNDQAAAAIKGLDGKDVGGQALRVAEARPRKSAPHA